LRKKLEKETVLLDGAFGTYIQSLGIREEDFGGRAGCLEHLSLSRSGLVRKVHGDYMEAGSDAIETNTFGGNALKLAEYGLSDRVFDLNRASVKLARDVADGFSTPSWPRYVIGTMGPTGKLPSSPDTVLGDITYGELKKVFYDQAAGIIAGGADALLIETAQDMLEMKAAVNAAKQALKDARKDLVIMAQFTLANNGRMLLGTEVSAVLAVIGYLGVDVIGINCSAGPLEMESAVRYLSANCPVFVSCVPNAGMPVEVGGRTVYSLAPEEMGEIMTRFVREYKLDVIGGCCGTGPDHIREMRGALSMPGKRKKKINVFCSGSYQGYDMAALPRPIIVGERINSQGSRKMKELLLAEDFDRIIELGKEQQKKGAHALDVCSVLTERSTEERDAVILTKRLAESVRVPLMIDSTDAGVIEAALCNYPGTAFINSVNLEDGGAKAGRVFSLAEEHGGFVVCLAIDERGMALTAERKLAVARRLYAAGVTGYGLASHRMIFDMLTFSLGTGEKEYRNAAVDTFDAIKRVKEEFPGVLTVLGVSNISFGLAKQGRRILNAVFLRHAVRAGLDMAIVDPADLPGYSDIPEREKRIAEDLVFNRHPDALNGFVEYFSRKTAGKRPEPRQEEKLTVGQRLRNCVFDRNRAGIIPLIDEALESIRAEEILNDILLDAMRQVGDKLESGELVLPYVLQSAEVMRKAVEYLGKFLPAEHAQKYGKVLLATVFGDVHDIGKNLVKMILQNNGFTVIDLGKQVPVEEIIREAKKNRVDAVGLSALLVSTARYMKVCVQEMHEAGLHYPVIIGGAPVNERFAGEVSVLSNGSVYKGGVFYARDAFTALKITRSLLSGPDERKKVMDEYYRRLERTREQGPAAEKARETRPGQGRKRRGKVPVPPFYGVRSVSNISVDDVFSYLDENMLLNVTWGTGLKDRREKDRLVEEEYRPLLSELKEESLRRGWLDLKAVYGYFECRVIGGDMRVLDADGKVLETFQFAAAKGSKSPVLTDYFLSGNKGKDVVAFQAVTVGDRINDAINGLNEAGKYSRTFFLHGLSVRLAEALAAYIHDRIRGELKLKQGQGKRYSPGYPLWRNIEDQKKIFRILDVEKRISVRLTEGCQMVPEQSTTAMVVYSALAEY
ncbi:MAG: homocysteine S-methyltransferase family protein, partial [Candidatus Omnitrophica bacterium]|nr:homocysteine S-methyltransferase family protein [Candidatus Omnitrophota bacterium]